MGIASSFGSTLVVPQAYTPSPILAPQPAASPPPQVYTANPLPSNNVTPDMQPSYGTGQTSYPTTAQNSTYVPPQATPPSVPLGVWPGDPDTNQQAVPPMGTGQYVQNATPIAYPQPTMPSGGGIPKLAFVAAVIVGVYLIMK